MMPNQGQPSQLQDAEPELVQLLAISRAFKMSKALNLAGKLGVVSACAAKPKGLTLVELCGTLGLKTGIRGTQDYFDLLVSMDVLQRQGDGQGARYLPHPATQRYLLGPDESPTSITGILTLNNDRSGPLFDYLEAGLRHGQVPADARTRVPDITAVFAGTAAPPGPQPPAHSPVAPPAQQQPHLPQGDEPAQPPDGPEPTPRAAVGPAPQVPAAVQSVQGVLGPGETTAPGGAGHFALGMLGASVGNFRRLAQVMDFSKHMTVLDVGGSTGCACVALCAAHPHLRAITLDLPAVHDVAVRYVAQHGLSDRVQVWDQDMFSALPYPPADVIIMGMVLHDWGIDKKKLLIRKAREALRPGGVLVAVEHLVDDDRRTASAALASSLNMLLEFGNGCAFDFSAREFSEWARDAGFNGPLQCLPLVGTASAALAYV